MNAKLAALKLSCQDHQIDGLNLNSTTNAQSNQSLLVAILLPHAAVSFIGSQAIPPHLAHGYQAFDISAPIIERMSAKSIHLWIICQFSKLALLHQVFYNDKLSIRKAHPILWVLGRKQIIILQPDVLNSAIGGASLAGCPARAPIDLIEAMPSVLPSA